MAYTATSIFGQRLEERLEPWLDPAGDLARLCDAIGAMLAPILTIAEEEGSDGEPGYMPAYGHLLDPVTCPGGDLGYLSNFVGLTLPNEATEPEKRALIKEEPGLARGTAAAVEAAIRRNLTGAKNFTIAERTAANGSEDAYHFLIILSAAEMPSQAALEQAVQEVKPAGVFFTIVTVEGAWLDGTLTWEEIGAGVTWEALKEGNF